MKHFSSLLATLFWLLFGNCTYASDFHIIATEDSVHGVRAGTPIEILGQEIGKVGALAYSDDGRMIDVRLLVKDEMASAMVNSLYAVVAEDHRGSVLELHRRADPLGVRLIEVPKGLLVKRVFDGSTASRIGIAKDDILISVNNESVRTIDKWEVFTNSLQDKARLSVRLVRNGKEGTQIGVADFRSGAIRLKSGDSIPLEIARGERRKVSSSDASAAVKRAADGILPQLKSTLTTALELGDVVMSDIDGLLGKVNNAMDEELAELLSKMDATVDSMGDAVRKVTPAAKSTIDDYDRIGVQLERLLFRVENILGVFEAEVQYLPGTMATANQMICQSAEMVDAIRFHWLMRRVVNRQQRRQMRR